MNAAWTQNGTILDASGSALGAVWRALAQAVPGPAPVSPSGAGGQMFLLAILAAFMVFMLLSTRSQRKREERDRETMLNSLAKNDRVLTIGGIIGTIVSIKDSEVVLKVDESTNTKMTFAKSAVQKVLREEGK